MLACVAKCSRGLPEKLNRSSTGQEIPRILCNPKIYYRIHKNHPPIPIQSQIYSVHFPHPTPRRFILILSAHLRLGLPSGFLPSGFPTKTQYAPILSPIRATYPAHFSLLDLLTRINVLAPQPRNIKSRDSSIGIGTAMGRRSRYRIPAGARISAAVQTGPRVYSASHTMGTGSPSRG